MRIAYFCNKYPPAEGGGIATAVRALAHGMKDVGHSVTVVGIAGKPEERDDEGVRVVVLKACPPRGLSSLLTRLKLRNWLSCEARAGRVDVVEVPEYEGWLPFKLDGCPVVVRLHMSATMTAHEAGKRPQLRIRWYERQTLHSHRNWIGASKYILSVTQESFGITPIRSKVVYNPVSAAFQRPTTLPNAVPGRYVLNVGTVSERKGALALAAAAKIFLPKHPDVLLVFVGHENAIRGEPASVAIREALGPTLARRVLFVDHLPLEKVVGWMQHAAVCAFPSFLEACPLSWVEAMSLGKAVLASSLGPGPEIIKDGVAGLLADPRRPREIAHKIDLMLNDRQLCQRLGLEARDRVSQLFSLDRIVRDSVAFYEEILAEARGVTRHSQE